MTVLTWDRIARYYDWQLALERGPIGAAVELAAPRVDDRWLDTATGTGAVLRSLERCRSRPREVIGLDSSAAMLARVPSLPRGWSLRQGDVTSLPFPGAHFDVVTAAFLLHLLEPPAVSAALGEIRRVLKPDGRLVTVTPIAPRSLLQRPYELVVAALIHLTPYAAGLRPYDPTPDLMQSGFSLGSARYVPNGYPSLCVLARAAPCGSGAVQASLHP